jgi:hypothetical protein
MATQSFKAPMFQSRKRRSRVAGTWGFSWLHANEFGGAVLKGKTGLRTVMGFIVKLPHRYVTVQFRRRELKL